MKIICSVLLHKFRFHLNFMQFHPRQYWCKFCIEGKDPSPETEVIVSCSERRKIKQAEHFSPVCWASCNRRLLLGLQLHSPINSPYNTKLLIYISLIYISQNVKMNRNTTSQRVEKLKQKQLHFRNIESQIYPKSQKSTLKAKLFSFFLPSVKLGA